MERPVTTLTLSQASGTYPVSAAFAGFSGALYASVIGFISPSVFTLTASVSFLAMAVIGGTGSLAGPILAAVLLTLLQYLDALIPGISRNAAQLVQAYEPDVYGLAIVLVVLLVVAVGLGLGGNESYPDVFAPFGGFADNVPVATGPQPLEPLVLELAALASDRSQGSGRRG